MHYLTSFVPEKMTSIIVLDGLKMLQIHVNLCNTVQLLGGSLQCNGQKLEEAEDFECIIVIYCVLESK